GAEGWCSWKAAGDPEDRVPGNRVKDDSNYEGSLLRIVALAFAVALTVALTFALPLTFTLPFAFAVLAIAFALTLTLALIVLWRSVEDGRCGDCQQQGTAADDALQKAAASCIDAIEQCVFAHLSFTSSRWRMVARLRA